MVASQATRTLPRSLHADVEGLVVVEEGDVADEAAVRRGSDQELQVFFAVYRAGNGFLVDDIDGLVEHFVGLVGTGGFGNVLPRLEPTVAFTALLVEELQHEILAIGT